jgi:hypothetical protein
VPDKRYSPFAKQKVVPRGLDSIRACRSVPGRTCTPRQVEGGDEDCEVVQPEMRTASAQSSATRWFVRAEPGTRGDGWVAGLPANPASSSEIDVSKRASYLGTWGCNEETLSVGFRSARLDYAYPALRRVPCTSFPAACH